MRGIEKWLIKTKKRISLWLIKILTRINNTDFSHYPNLYFIGYIAAEYGDEELMIAVLNTGGDRLSCLRIAAKHGQIEIIRLFFEKESVINKDKFAFFNAVENNHPRIVEMFIAAGVDIQADNNYAMRRAREKHYLEIENLLIKANVFRQVQE